jgi:Penicillin binding protein transpeptidase domain/Penicillin-binding Protein dimerisation domain
VSDTDVVVEREKSHWIRVTILALIPILIVAGAGIFVLSRHHKPDHRQQEAQAAMSAYLASWSRANYAGMAAHADVSAAAIAAVDARMRRNLIVTAASYTPGLLTRDKTGDRGTAPYTARLTLRGFGAWSYAGSLALVKTKDSAKQDVWRVQFTPAAIEPQLAANRVLERTHLTAARGQLLDAEGLPLRGADGDLDANLLGTVGPLTAAQAKAAGPGFSAGDIAGQTGIERVYNTQLAGDPGGSIVLMQGAIRLQTLNSYPAIAGRNVTTTIDLRVQRAGETALAPIGLPAAIVAIDTRTGGVLATVDHPLGGFARAIRGQYPPGSTFKVVTTTAALLAGRNENTPLDCPPTVNVDGNVFKNAMNESFGPINLITAFAKSCNTAFVNLRESMTEADMKRAATLYGFDDTQPLPIQSYGGSYPVPLNAVVAAAAAFGQGQVQTSPLQMASVAAAVAGGAWRQPFVAGRARVVHPIPPTVDQELKNMMRAVVTSGTADVLQFPGVVFGKTGTAEYGGGPNPPTHAWFIGWRGTVAFAVIVEGGGFGASVAAPIAANFLTALGPA